MERLEERLSIAQRALASLRELSELGDRASEVEGDAAIQRFEDTFEAVWKAAQRYLREMEGMVVGSPKGVIRACLQAGLLTEAEARLGLEMTDDRNLTLHTYNRELARAILGRIPEYVQLMGNWLEAMDRVLQ